MNEFEHDEEMIPHEHTSEDPEVTSGTEPNTEEAVAVESETQPVPPTRNSKRTKRQGRPATGRTREGKNSRPALSRRTGAFRRIVFISWSGEREPASELLWSEAVIEGEWVVVEKLEKVRTRKEILERILALDSALVALDFNFSYPAQFLEMLSATEGIKDWRSMIRTVRDDLKKNVDDGARQWVERLGRYRESFLDPEMPRTPVRLTRGTGDRGWISQQRSDFPPKRIDVHEQQSLAERFRRTDLPLLPHAGRNTMSTIQIGYNRLTERYEFNGNSRGKDALLGMAMLSQLVEAGRDDLAIWPMMELKKLTIVETLPWLFTEGKRLEPEALGSLLANFEDVGWHIPDEIQRSAAKTTKAQHTLLTLLGILKTELRLLPNRFPIRFYSPQMFHDPQVQLEGWTYGMNYRVHLNGNDAKANTTEEEVLQTNAIASEA